MKHPQPRLESPSARDEAKRSSPAGASAEAPTLEAPAPARVPVAPLTPQSAEQTLRALQPVSFRASSGEPRLGIEVRGAKSTDPGRRERHAPMDLMVVVMRVVQEQQRSIDLLKSELSKLQAEEHGRSSQEHDEGRPGPPRAEGSRESKAGR